VELTTRITLAVKRKYPVFKGVVSLNLIDPPCEDYKASSYGGSLKNTLAVHSKSIC